MCKVVHGKTQCSIVSSVNPGSVLGPELFLSGVLNFILSAVSYGGDVLIPF